jgi:cyclopropane fatty-acyl-phospholipid synthase-like methyltransferase
LSRPNSPAAERNREPILDVLRREFSDCRRVLEIGSGTGQHAVWFAAEMPWLTWQTSDREQNHQGINAWIDTAKVENVRRPLALDVQEPADIAGTYDAIFSANTAHIMSIAAVRDMFGLASELLERDGKFCLYGPFNRNGEFTSDSNRRFDESLRVQNPEMGIRNIEELDDFAGSVNLARLRFFAMPANNNLVVWVRTP